MSVVKSIQSQLVPIHPQGLPFIGAFALASLILFWIWSPLGLDRHAADRVVRLLLPRSAARHAGT